MGLIVLLAALPLLFAFLTALTVPLRLEKLAKYPFLAGAVAPWAVFLFEKAGNEVVGGWPRIGGIEVSLDVYNTPLVLGELILFTAVAVYSLDYFREVKAFVLLLLLHAGLLGAFISRDLFNFYIFMEIASVSSFALVGSSGKRKAVRAAYKYLMLSLLASYFFVFSIGVIYLKTGYLNLELISESVMPSKEINVAIAIAFASLLLKAGIFPLHVWLPDAHSLAPTPVSALLSGAVVKAPAYGMILIFSALPVSEGLSETAMVLAVASIFFGVAMALLQKDAKRLLAYHTVSQMGYVLLGIASMNFVGAAYYAMAHSLFKGGLFLSVGSLGKKSRKLGEFGYKNAPLMALSVLMLSLAIGGVSPFIGSYAKGLISSGLAGAWKWAVLAGSVGTLVSFTKLNYYLTKGEAPALPLSWKFASFALALAAFVGGLVLGAVPKVTDVYLLLAGILLFLLFKMAGVFELTLEKEDVKPGEVNTGAMLFALFLLLLLYLAEL
ncbi:proton-conducting transporter transmembrane domain-containing protein [Thermococcus guaymasensis]|uniref:proton-conducting transporter transmembrane domain-containing protein n=1 Tax=Thermococcus guaymasensis TaxID=110164 RepID=UPI00316AE340